MCVVEGGDKVQLKIPHFIQYTQVLVKSAHQTALAYFKIKYFIKKTLKQTNFRNNAYTLQHMNTCIHKMRYVVLLDQRNFHIFSETERNFFSLIQFVIHTKSYHLVMITNIFRISGSILIVHINFNAVFSYGGYIGTTRAYEFQRSVFIW